MEKRYQIFISSTYEDLIEERQKVFRAILKLYHFPIGMEMFHADNEEQWSQIKRTIDMSDYYVLIVGRCCRTLIEEEKISYTEKEYNYAMSKGIPVLSFIISDKARKESYGMESAAQQRAYKKFVKKVKKLPCGFWKTPDELAFLVSTTLSLKFQENNRNGWMPYNECGVMGSAKIEKYFVGNYDLLYFTELRARQKKLVHYRLIIDEFGKVVLYNNVKQNIRDAEYIYHGMCEVQENVIYIVLKNDNSRERAFITFIRPVGNLNRYIGMFMALSSNLISVCIKVACFKEDFKNKTVNMELIESIVPSANVDWENNMLIIEDKQKHLFFSDEIFSGSDDCQGVSKEHEAVKPYEKDL